MPADPTGRPDLFVLEAGGALQELGRLLGQEARPAESAVRSARILRGASLMAGPPDFTRAAVALEAVLRSVRDGQVPWDPGTREVLGGAVEGLEALVRRSRQWGPPDSAAALRLASELDRLGAVAGVSPTLPFGRRAADRQEPGVRAFLSREAAMVAGSLERLARDPGALARPAAIENVLRTTQPLRGVAFLSEVPPLGDLLEVIEQLLREALHGTPLPPRAAEGLSLLAGALTHAARDLTEGGTPAVDAPELAGAARLVLEVVSDESDIVPVDQLFQTGDTTPVLRRGTPPTAELPGPDASLALLSLGARLAQGAEQLQRTPAGPLRQLQQVALMVGLRAGLPPRPALPVDRMVAALVRALARGSADADPEGFSAALRQATAGLTALAEGTAESNAPTLVMVTGLFETLPGRPPASPPPEPAGAGAEPPPVPVETLLEEPEEPVVPIESLLAGEPVPPIGSRVLVESLPPEGGPSFDLLESSLRTYQQLLAAVPEAILPATMAPAAPRPARRPAEAATPATQADGPVVPIESLLYRGRRALERADEVRREIDAIIAAIRAERRLEPLIRELMDLVPLALDDPR